MVRKTAPCLMLKRANREGTRPSVDVDVGWRGRESQTMIMNGLRRSASQVLSSYQHQLGFLHPNRPSSYVLE